MLSIEITLNQRSDSKLWGTEEDTPSDISGLYNVPLYMEYAYIIFFFYVRACKLLCALGGNYDTG